MITRAIQLDLSRESESCDRRAIGSMYGIANGDRVVLLLGTRKFPPPWTVQHLAQYAATHHLDLWGTQAATEAWAAALRGESGFAWSA